MTFYISEVQSNGSKRVAEKITASNLRCAKQIASKRQAFCGTVLQISQAVDDNGFIKNPICTKIGSRWIMTD